MKRLGSCFNRTVWAAAIAVSLAGFASAQQTTPQAPSSGAKTRLATGANGAAHAKAKATTTPVPPKPDISALRKRAEAGDAEAANELGDAFSIGTAGLRDFTEATKWYQRAADQGDARAQIKLGMMHEGGFGVPRDINQAVALYLKAAEQNNITAIMRLATIYHQGRIGFDANETEALKWTRKGAELGDIDGQIAMGNFYLTGVPGLLKADPVEAMKWYRMAADQGDPTAMYQVARMYQQGTGVPVNVEEAKVWYRKSAEKGSSQALMALRKLQ